jgi:hypothetical protein
MNLEAEFIVEYGKGHFNEDGSITDLPRVPLSVILEVINGPRVGLKIRSGQIL